MINYAPFDGDGRRKVNPHSVHLPNTVPMVVTNGQACRTIASFVNGGHTTHSAQGATLWVILVWLQHQKIPYNLRAHPMIGYCVSKEEPL